jgi:hypothetical protein
MDYHKADVGILFLHGPTGTIINQLDYCVGQRTPDASTVHVRGRSHDAVFAGSLVIREGRDDLDSDIKAYGEYRDCARLAEAIDAALTECSPVVAQEMARICGGA